MGKFLVLDLGTTYFKFSLFDGDGQLVCCHRSAPPIVQSQAGRCELPAEQFETTVRSGIAATLDAVDNNRCEARAVTFATQANSFLLLDAGNRPLTPIILWPDDRARNLEAEIREGADLPEFSATTGVPQLNCEFMAAKLLWLQREQAEVWKKASRICLISDYLTYLMTGKFATEASIAGLSGMANIRRAAWWDAVCDRFSVRQDLLPAIVKAGTDLGPLSAEASTRFRLPSDCRFVAGCLDQYAGAIGVGAVEPGMMAETTGTVLAAVLCSDQFITSGSQQLFQGPAFDRNLSWRMAFGNVSANYLQWYRDQLPDRPDFDQLSQAASKVEAGADGLRMKTEVAMSTVDDVFAGCTTQITRGHFVRSIMEGVAEALAGHVNTLCPESSAVRPHEIRAAGGGAKSQLWLQIKADLLGIPVTATECDEPTSLGAAILAEATISRTAVLDVARRWVRLKSTWRPQRQARDKRFTETLAS